MMDYANNEMLTDKEFSDQVFLLYTDKHRKRFEVERNIICKLRASFKEGISYGMTMLQAIFPPHLPDSSSREEMFRFHIEMERMESRLKEMEIWRKHRDAFHMEKIKNLTRERDELQEMYYDCQAELLQEKEYTKLREHTDA